MPPKITARGDRPSSGGTPQNDAYTVLLGVSLGALILGIVLLWIDYSQYDTGIPPKTAPPTIKPAGADKEAAGGGEKEKAAPK